MRTGILAGTILCGLALFAAQSNYKLEQREPVHHTFAKDTTLDIDIVNGAVIVVGEDTNSIRVDGEKITRAETQEELERGKREVVLDANEKSGTAQLYANGPFRDNSHASESHGFHETNDRHYSVSFNLTAHVPRAMALHLRNVNGEVKAEGTSGSFDVRAVNGAIALTGVAGAGKAETVNGAVVVTFRENPKADSSFRTINGRIDVSLNSSLNANIGLKTLNGHAFTDFETTMLAASPTSAQRQDGRFVYKTNEFRNLRVGTGGPELKFETLNGDIHITKQAH